MDVTDEANDWRHHHAFIYIYIYIYIYRVATQEKGPIADFEINECYQSRYL